MHERHADAVLQVSVQQPLATEHRELRARQTFELHRHSLLRAGDDGVDLGEVGVGERPVRRGRVRRDLLGLRRARDHAGDDRPRQQPRERELEQRVAVVARPRVERLDPVHDRVGERLLPAIGGHPREPRPRGRRRAPLVLARQHAAREREVRDERDVVLRARVEHTLLLGTAAQQAVLVLHADEARPTVARR